jgi:hypothetical protein
LDDGVRVADGGGEIDGNGGEPQEKEKTLVGARVT